MSKTHGKVFFSLSLNLAFFYNPNKNHNTSKYYNRLFSHYLQKHYKKLYQTIYKKLYKNKICHWKDSTINPMLQPTIARSNGCSKIIVTINYKL